MWVSDTTTSTRMFPRRAWQPAPSCRRATMTRFRACRAGRISIRAWPRPNNPVTRAVLTASRNWTDTNGNFTPDCDLSNPAVQDLSASGGDVCAKLNNTSFGLNNPNATTYSPDTTSGYGARSFNWQYSASVQQQLRRNVAIGFGYF